MSTPSDDELEGLGDFNETTDADAEAREEAPAHATKPPKGNTSGKDAIVIKALIRDTQAVRLRLEGCSYPEIARRLKFGHRGNAQRAVKRRLTGMREDCAEMVGELRQIEGMRLDIALAAVMPKVRSGDLLAIDRMLRIQERRAAYEGLDQPRGLKVEMAREIEGLLERLREEFDDDVYERVLAVFAGELGPPSLDRDSDATSGEGSGGTGGSGEAPPAAPTGE